MSSVNANMFAAAAGDINTHRRPGLMALPLNIIAMILAHLDDVADLARLCRTCRVLNYMTLPQLYRDLTLTSYDRIRYRDDVVEGCGSASPFSMGLSAVVTRKVGGLVRSMTLRGEWREDELEEHSRVGRVPDSSMMLNLVVRAGLDKMPGLESFSWQLNTKMLETVYLGLAQLPKLTSLELRFPSSRHPRPTTVVPPMPHLRALKITNIDPLCYPDDISTLLCKSKKLRELKLHWSPRMREAQEASVSLSDYFRKCIATKTKLALKKIAFHNLYALHREEVMEVMDPTAVEEVTVLNESNRPDDAALSFVDYSWPTPDHYPMRIKSWRFDRFDKKACEFLGTLAGLERLYLVNGIRDAGDYINSPRNLSSQSSTSLTPSSRESHFAGQNGTTHDGPPVSRADVINFRPHSPQPVPSSQPHLRDAFIQTIVSTHGSRLRHLLLPSRWPLPVQVIARLVRSCPNLEQLALATDISNMDSLSLVLPFLRKLVALRLLIPTPYPSTDTRSSRHDTPIRDAHLSALNSGANSNEQYSFSTFMHEFNPRTVAEIVDMDDRIHNEAMGATLADMEVFGTLKIVGLGWKAWELGELYTIPVSEGTREFHFLDASTIAEKYCSTLEDPSPSYSNHAAAESTGDGVTSNAGAGLPAGLDIPVVPEACRKSHPASRIWSTPPPSSLGKRKQPHDSNGVNNGDSNHNYNHNIISNRHPSPSSPSPPLTSASTTATNYHFAPALSRTSSISTIATAATPPTDPQPQTANHATPPRKHTRLQPPTPHPPPPPQQLQTTLSQFTHTSTGKPISQEAMAEMARCMKFRRQDPDGKVLYRRRVKRVGWDVLKKWEIWGLDVQEI
ncbi:hypothetical protein AJ79_07372 [Helicocarpus griseus UAMH5409]|uniref:F-box domain-containing protein n=1 Tax=Helicocarpus griseus UAMH5409 TaxID=1447875 RepID=A0A2B7X2Y5_9EURO|nr:hypothetical protein AJ79_07372 [Helicocarpus griseus UAMH5409]